MALHGSRQVDDDEFPSGALGRYLSLLLSWLMLTSLQSFAWMQALVPVVWAMAALKSTPRAGPGLAHGDAGVLLSLLQVWQFLSSHPLDLDHANSVCSQSVKASLASLVDRTLAAIETPVSIATTWSSGTPTAALLLATEAYDAFKDEKYLARARQAAEEVWVCGMVDSNVSLACGTAGNACALLRLFHSTADRRYLHYGLQFGKFLLLGSGEVGDENARVNPFTQPDSSLANGRAGACLAMAAMLSQTETTIIPCFM